MTGIFIEGVVKMINWQTSIGVWLTIAGTALAAAPQREAAPPPNAPVEVRWDAQQGGLSLTYHGTVVLDATIAVWDKDGGNASAGITMQPAVTAGVEKMYLTFYLEYLTRKVDCYFTVEQAATSPDVLTRNVEADKTVKTIPEMVAAIKRQLEGFEVFQSPDCPAVVHIISNEARSIPDYWLDSRRDLSFGGSPDGLLRKILPLGQRVTQESVFVTNAMPCEDVRTEVSLVAKGLAVRSILTDFMPLSRYSRLLWSATTEQRAGTQRVAVSFEGQVESDEARSNEIVPFSEGDTAFYRNKKSEAVIKAAIDYVNSEMQKETPYQVRWAMFYLGKQGATEAVPLLLKHLTYKYTTCGVLEESFPATRALSMMGKIASAAALKAIGTETDSLRLRLLCRVVLLVEGQGNGAKAVEAEAAKSAGDRQQLILDALKAAAEPQPLPAPRAGK